MKKTLIPSNSNVPQTVVIGNMGKSSMTFQPEFPSAQTIWIRQRDPNIMVSCPAVDQFFSNVQYNSNQGYCFYQLTYFDIPLADDVTGILSTNTLAMEFKIIVTYRHPETGAFQTEYGVTGVDVQLDDHMNAIQLGELIRSALFRAAH